MVEVKLTKKFNYFTTSEIRRLTKNMIFIQATLGIQSCRTKGEVCDVLRDIWVIAQMRKKK